MKAKDIRVGDCVRYKQGVSGWIRATVRGVDKEVIWLINDAGRKFTRLASKLRKA